MNSKHVLNSIRDFLNLPVVAGYQRQQTAAGLRGEVSAHWLDEALNGLVSSKTVDPTKKVLIDDKTGQPHSVSSLVAELRDRVKLDLVKEGSNLPLSSKMAAAADSGSSLIYQAMQNFIESRYGKVDTPAVIYFLREIFGDEIINKMEPELLEKIELIKQPLDVEKEVSPDVGRAMKMTDMSASDNQLFKTIEDGLHKSQ